MSDDITTRSGLISLEREHEISYWTKSLGVSEDELREAVQAVGPSAGKVRQYLSYAGSVL